MTQLLMSSDGFNPGVYAFQLINIAIIAATISIVFDYIKKRIKDGKSVKGL